MTTPTEDLPLPTLLSPALVAFTIEFDNAAESQMIHRTTKGTRQSARGPWLVSQVMWANVVQHVPDEGITRSQLHLRSRTTEDSLHGLQRWGYLKVEEGGAKDPLVRLTSHGRRVRAVWEPLAAQIEQRWIDRFGTTTVSRLRAALKVILDQLELALPSYLPIIHPSKDGGRVEVPPPPDPSMLRGDTALDLSVQLARALHAFTLDFEARSPLSLALCATTLRVLDPAGRRIRELPRLTGVSREANSMCIGFLERRGLATTGPDPGASRGKGVRLNPEGVSARQHATQLVASTEADWRTRFGAGPMEELRGALAAVVGNSPSASDSPLFAGLIPPEGGWRAKGAKPETLPHYPMVLHRGGFPDGS